MLAYFTLSLGFRGCLNACTVAHSVSLTKMLKLQMLVKIIVHTLPDILLALVVGPCKMKKTGLLLSKELRNQ